MFQKSVKTDDESSKETKAPPVKFPMTKARVDTEAVEVGQPAEKSFDLSRSAFAAALSAARHSTASASAASARDNSETASQC